MKYRGPHSRRNTFHAHWHFCSFVNGWGTKWTWQLVLGSGARVKTMCHCNVYCNRCSWCRRHVNGSCPPNINYMYARVSIWNYNIAWNIDIIETHGTERLVAWMVVYFLLTLTITMKLVAAVFYTYLQLYLLISPPSISGDIIQYNWNPIKPHCIFVFIGTESFETTNNRIKKPCIS